jgi:quinol monooxygenase YgiN
MRWVRVSFEERRLRILRKATMILLLQHTVRDYDAWKPVFDEHQDVRAKYGALGHTIYRDADKPNEVTILMQFESRERAEGLMRDPSLAEAMQRGGVVSEPHATWLEGEATSSYSKRAAA